MAAPPRDGTPYKMPDYPPGGPYPCSAPPPRFLGPPIRADEFNPVPAPVADETAFDGPSAEPTDPNGPAICGMSQLDPGFLPLGAGGPAPPQHEMVHTMHIAPGPPRIIRCGTMVPQVQPELTAPPPTPEEDHARPIKPMRMPKCPEILEPAPCLLSKKDAE